MSVEYLHLIPNGPLRDINCWRPFRAGVIIEDKRIHYDNLEVWKKCYMFIASFVPAI
jgi:hypothetical protein